MMVMIMGLGRPKIRNDSSPPGSPLIIASLCSLVPPSFPPDPFSSFSTRPDLLCPLLMHHDESMINTIQTTWIPHDFEFFLSASPLLIFRTDLFLSAFWTTNYASDSAVLAAASNNEASALCHGCFVTGPDTIRIAILTPKAIRPWTMNEALTWSTTVQKKKGLDLNFSAAFISFSFFLLLLL